MSRAAARARAESSAEDTLADHLSNAIDELLQLQPIAAAPWRSANQTVDLIDDMNRIGKRLARVGRS